MSKAYDHMAWDFLETVMRKMGLHDTIVNLIMKCVCSTSLSIIINGTPKASYIYQEDFGKGTSSHHICFSYARKAL